MQATIRGRANEGNNGKDGARRGFTARKLGESESREIRSIP